MEWDKISESDTTDKGLISKTCNLYSSISNNLIKKWAEVLNRHVSKEDRCS